MQKKAFSETVCGKNNALPAHLEEFALAGQCLLGFVHRFELFKDNLSYLADSTFVLLLSHQRFLLPFSLTSGYPHTWDITLLNQYINSPKDFSTTGPEHKKK